MRFFLYHYSRDYIIKPQNISNSFNSTVLKIFTCHYFREKFVLQRKTNALFKAHLSRLPDSDSMGVYLSLHLNYFTSCR